MKHAACLLILALLPPLAAAQAYRWVDEKGQVHYSQVPPKGKDVRRMGPPPPPSANPNQDSLNQSLQKDQAGRDYMKDQLDQRAQRQAEKEQQCKQFREQLAYMDRTPPVRMTTTDDKGNVSRITEEQHRARRAELANAVSTSCS